jgi:hypothetical protein
MQSSFPGFGSVLLGCDSVCAGAPVVTRAAAGSGVVLDRGMQTWEAIIPAGRGCGLLIASGYPAGRPLAPILRPDCRVQFDQVVYWD